jgi:regulatory protein
MTSQKPSRDNKINDSTLEDARRVALNLLARREHSRLEMQYKLSRRGYGPTVIDAVLEWLMAEELLNEHRYAELYAHSRADKGYGPVRIRQELCERGVPLEIIATILGDLEGYWMPKLAALQRKRFGSVVPVGAAGRAQQFRFLRHRGFTSEQIKALFRGA